MRYTFHGGGPCDGALNGAVMRKRARACPVDSHKDAIAGVRSWNPVEKEARQ